MISNRGKSNLIRIIAFSILVLGGAQYKTLIGQVGSLKASRSITESYLHPLVAKYNDFEAVIIEDRGRIRFIEGNGGGYDYLFERRMQYKINSASGLHWAEIEIPLSFNGRGEERLLDASAIVINDEGGSLRKYGKKDLEIYVEAYKPNLKMAKFAIPGAKEGSVIEVFYSFRSPWIHSLENWYFQQTVPVVRSEFNLWIIPFYEYSMQKRGTNSLSSFFHVDSNEERLIGIHEFYERIFTWIMTDVPAFDDETFIANRSDYIDHIEFQLRRINQLTGAQIDIMKDWPAVNKEMLENSYFGKFLNAAKKHSKGAASVYAKSDAPSIETIDNITGYVKTNFKYNGYQSKFATDKLKSFVNSGEGNSADLNLYLVGMLNAAGIEAHPLLISTRSHGRVFKDSPMHGNFNYVIAAIPQGKTYILRDATDINYPDNQLPVKCLNGQGLLIQKDLEHWVNVTTGEVSSSICHSIKLNLDPDENKIQTHVSIASTGYDAVNAHRSIGDDPEEVENDYENRLLEELDSIIIADEGMPRDSFYVSFQSETETDVAGKRIFLEPFAGLPEAQSPLTKKKRSYPVDIVYPRSRIFVSSIEIPEGYNATYVPKDYYIKNELVKLDYHTLMEEDGKLRIEAELSFNKRVYPVKDYARLRYFWEDMVKRLNEKIVLETGT